MVARRQFLRCCILFLGAMLCNLCSYVVCQEEYTVEQLRNMTDEDLEQICVVRGFEIMQDEIDPATGLLYDLTHDDFVEVAQRCLAIEKELNELLAEHPELAAEVEKEIRQMEAERDSRKAEVKILQEELRKAEAAAAANAGVGDSSGAFLQSAVSLAPEETSVDQSSGDDFEIVEHIQEVSANEKTTEDDIALQYSRGDVQSDNTHVMAENATKSEEDFTLGAITYEVIRAMIKQLEGDIKRIAELMAPVIRPVLRAGDVAWRHLRVAFESIRTSYNNSTSSE